MATERGPPWADDPANLQAIPTEVNQQRREPKMTKTFLDAADIPEGAEFVKSSRSGAAGHCVELAEMGGGIALRHSKAPQQGAFLFSGGEMSAFVEGAKNGEFDHLI